VILIATISVSVVILLNSNYENEDFDNFTFDAVYLKDSNSILITFDDTNQKSSFAILEILGMEKTFHEEFAISDSKFTKIVPIDNIPKYGWKTTPVTLEITYDESVVYMKTEIHEEDQISPTVIFGKND
jgi:GTPase SAR1 family protein